MHGGWEQLRCLTWCCGWICLFYATVLLPHGFARDSWSVCFDFRIPAISVRTYFAQKFGSFRGICVLCVCFRQALNQNKLGSGWCFVFSSEALASRATLRSSRRRRSCRSWACCSRDLRGWFQGPGYPLRCFCCFNGRALDSSHPLPAQKKQTTHTTWIFPRLQKEPHAHVGSPSPHKLGEAKGARAGYPQIFVGIGEPMCVRLLLKSGNKSRFFVFVVCFLLGGEGVAGVIAAMGEKPTALHGVWGLGAIQAMFREPRREKRPRPTINQKSKCP